MQKRIKVVTTYTNVDDDFLDYYIANTIPNSHVFGEEFRKGEPVIYTSKDPEGETIATTTWQLVEEYEQ